LKALYTVASLLAVMNGLAASTALSKLRTVGWPRCSPSSGRYSGLSAYMAAIRRLPLPGLPPCFSIAADRAAVSTSPTQGRAVGGRKFLSMSG
jgi:hypothetical protein